MKFKLTDHAEKRIQQRKIKPEWIEAALEHPARTENDIEDANLVHALLPIPEKGFQVLRVIYNETTEPINIVTVYFDERVNDL
ncbi:MAG: DUF4258 domain-containing protein [Sulfuricellaceae bacterium]|nr:DUF4258 domain-containing protein [Sulfuricellaceae bacterium]